MRINVELVDGRTAVVELRMPCALSAWKTREVHRELGHDPALGPHAIVRATGPDGSHDPAELQRGGDPTFYLASYGALFVTEGERQFNRMYCGACVE